MTRTAAQALKRPSKPQSTKPAKPQGKRTGWGQRDEQRVKDFFRSHNVDVRDSSRHEDFHQDIDAHIENLITVEPLCGGKEMLTASIKSQQMALKTKKLCFELRVATESETGKDGYFDTAVQRFLSWHDSTWYLPKDIYLNLIGNDIYVIEHEKLDAYVKANGWEYTRQLAYKTKLNQLERGHSHLNSEVGIIAVKTLLDDGLMVKVGTVQD